MIVVFDTNYIIYLLDRKQAEHPVTDSSGNIVERLPDKIDHLLSELRKKKARILIPTPVLAELFTNFGEDTNQIMSMLNSAYGIEFADFNTAAAIETGIELNKAKKNKLPRGQKFKFDRQIVSIAKVNNADVVYSNDKQVCNWAKKAGMEAVNVWDLPNPPQVQMELPESEEDQDETINLDDEPRAD